jgi:hypothetical protein
MVSTKPIWVPRVAVATRYNVNPRTIARWEADPYMGFPKSREIRKRHYTDERELDAYDAQARIKPSPAAA